MSKKALLHHVDLTGPTGTEGKRVLEVVESGQEFEVHPDLGEWVDCPDSVVAFKYWKRTSDNAWKQLPENVHADETAGALATDADGNPTEEYVWDWDNESWSKQAL